MDTFITICQIVVGLGIYNVWLLRFGKSTAYRGGNARNMKEEFAVYGLPPGFVYVIGTFKILFATMLLLGVFFQVLTMPAAIGMALLMLGAVAMHIKVKDPPQKALPATSLLLLSILIAVV